MKRWSWRWWRKVAWAVLAATAGNLVGESLGSALGLPPIWIGWLKGSFSTTASIGVMLMYDDTENTVEAGEKEEGA